MSQTYLWFCLNICMFCVCVVTKLLRVLFKSLYVVHLCCLKVSVGSVYMFACFAFVLSQTYHLFCSNVCISCICVVTNALCVLLKYLLVPQLCRHNRLLDPVLLKRLYVVHLCCLKLSVGSVYMFACFTFVLSQTHNMFCSIVCISYICVVTNVLCVLLKYLLVLQLCPHNRLVDPVLIKHLYVLRLCRHKRMLQFF